MVECRLRIVEELSVVRVVNLMAVILGVMRLVSVVHVVQRMVWSVDRMMFCGVDVMRVMFRNMVLRGVIIDCRMRVVISIRDVLI